LARQESKTIQEPLKTGQLKGSILPGQFGQARIKIGSWVAKLARLKQLACPKWPGLNLKLA
jgi:hypothetical protein